MPYSIKLGVKLEMFRQNMRAFFKSREGREVILLLAVIVVVLCFGTISFHVVEGWDLFDAFFMTVVTLSTVGYGETHPLSYAGRWLAVVLIFLGVGVAGVAFTTLSDFIIKRQVLWVFERRRMREQIQRLEKHTVLCGYGRLCKIAALELRQSGSVVVIVDQDESKVKAALDAGYFVVKGDVTVDETLIEAGIRKAARLVTLLPKDADNLYVILTSRELNPSLFILSRTEDDIGEKRLKRAGADRIISPYRVGGQKIADRLLRPYVADFIDLAVSSTKGDFQIEEIVIPPSSRLHGVSLKDSGLRRQTNVIIAAILSPSGHMIFNPSAETIIESEATLIGIGLKSDLAELGNLLMASKENGA